MVCAVSLRREPYGEKTRSGHFPEEEIIALRNLDDKSGPRGLLQEENLGILKYMC